MSAAKGGQEKKSVVVVEKVSRTLEQARAQSKVHETTKTSEGRKDRH